VAGTEAPDPLLQPALAPSDAASGALADTTMADTLSPAPTSSS
jgi:hypothetical protein